jgi:hypothetical protein
MSITQTVSRLIFTSGKRIQSQDTLRKSVDEVEQAWVFLRTRLFFLASYHLTVFLNPAIRAWNGSQTSDCNNKGSNLSSLQQLIPNLVGQGVR